MQSGIIETTARRRGNIGMWEYVPNGLPSPDFQILGPMANQILEILRAMANQILRVKGNIFERIGLAWLRLGPT